MKKPNICRNLDFSNELTTSFASWAESDVLLQIIVANFFRLVSEFSKLADQIDSGIGLPNLQLPPHRRNQHFMKSNDDCLFPSSTLVLLSKNHDLISKNKLNRKKKQIKTMNKERKTFLEKFSIAHFSFYIYLAKAQFYKYKYTNKSIN